jgi:hypothetical protein
MMNTVYASMCYQTDHLTECLITQFTRIWSLTHMYALMCFKITTATEFPFTHITCREALITMYMLMFYQTDLLTECFLTHFTRIWMLIPIYIIGISAFSILYLKMFIQSTLVKTQSLNIRIYSDSNNNYFYNDVYMKQKSTVFEVLLFITVY